MKNLYSQTDDENNKCFSDLIKDFSYCRNTFITSDGDQT
jgi:hypothetical protein